MNEHSFIRAVHKQIKKRSKDCYAWKIRDSGQGGVADCWYDGIKDLWIEYKWTNRIPKNNTVIPTLSKQQIYWLSNRRKNGRNVYVVIGCPDGVCIIHSSEWATGVTNFTARLITKTQLAELIIAFTADKINALSAGDTLNEQKNNSHQQAGVTKT